MYVVCTPAPILIGINISLTIETARFQSAPGNNFSSQCRADLMFRANGFWNLLIILLLKARLDFGQDI